MTTQRTNYRTSKIKTFLFFLLLATIFWVLTKFSKDSSANVLANLVYINVPTGVSVSEKNIDEISFSISGNGFEMLSYKLQSPTIEIDLANYYEKGDSLILISSSELSNLISEQLESKNRITSMSKEELLLTLDTLVTKVVPIELITDITFKEGYNAIEPLHIKPDSVQISGPSELVAEIDIVQTTMYSNNAISEDISEDILLDTDSLGELSLLPTKVELSAKISEFTQKELSVPIEILNVPSDVNLRLLPEETMISFNVSVHRFNSVTASDFKVVCDYSKKTPNGLFLLPKITTQPNGIYHVELHTKQVEYLIFK